MSLLACPKPTFALPYRDPFSESSATCSVVPLVHQICSFPPPPAALHFVPSASLNSRTSTGPVHLGQLQVGFERGKPPAPNTPKTNTPLPTPTPHASTRPPAPLPYYCTSRVCFRLVRPPPPSSPTPGRRTGKVVGTTIYTQHPFVLAQVTASHHGTGTNAVLISLTSDLLGLG